MLVCLKLPQLGQPSVEFALPCRAKPISVGVSSAAAIEDVSAGIVWTDGSDELPALGHAGSGEGITGPSVETGEEELGREFCECTRSGKPGVAAAFPSDARAVGVDSDSCIGASLAVAAPAGDCRNRLQSRADWAAPKKPSTPLATFDAASWSCCWTASTLPTPRAIAKVARYSAAAAATEDVSD